MTNFDASAPEMVLVRYGELALKGKNRGMFEQALIRNMRSACASISPLRVEQRRGRITVIPERRVGDVARRLQDVFGIKTVSPAWGAEPTPEAIAEIARLVLADALLDYPPGVEIPFRVRSSRSEKRFPLTSVELDQFVAPRALEGVSNVKVDLKHPELTLGIEVRTERAYVFVKRLPGPGGLPGGTLGRVLCLLSGGIDSPVAAWLAMKRGCHVDFVTFHSYPYIGEASKQKVVALVRALSRFQAECRLFVLPFTEVQEAIRDNAPPPYRTVLYRRMMQRLASRIAQAQRMKALVTGESLGQVASQTLENMACIGAAAELPVIRPLSCYDKEEAIEIARRIGTFELSTLPEPDCCTVFMPPKAVIKGRLDVCEESEALLDVEGLVERSLAGVEVIDVAG
ncbi:MAG: tRNA 4-thiouridine(8) synthase ThiI [Planctomycetes bacterium]|nr:tRNA 4-thiouridine(8) synthase ThiI [Planctomycetota bacterium]MCB9903087.1 tRNA 4-thiouridine(8) synthase ThiI [Planctomycetota bacterium]